VITQDQNVSLFGRIDTYCDRQRAAYVASRVFGVEDVETNIEVGAAETPKSDEQIKDDIEHKLAWSALVDSRDVRVAVKDGTATLTGTVRGWEELKAAVDDAFDGGALAVKSQLVVRDMPEYYPTFYRQSYNRPLP
jgi:osmotically-inducible protein OsmY